MTTTPDATDPIELEADDPPKNGEWIDVHDVLANPTPEELADGARMGTDIDPDDDEDNGGVATDV